MAADIVLASASPRRAEILGMIGLRFRTVTAGVCEDTDAGYPDAVVEELAARKAKEVNVPHGTLVISADTVVALDDVILGKPHDESDAKHMLAMLSGRRHEVYTGVCLRRGDITHVFHEKTVVEFSPLSDSEIKNYIATGEPMDNTSDRIWNTEEMIKAGWMDESGKWKTNNGNPPECLDKAGAYGIQGIGSKFIRGIEGDFYNVMGFPVCAFYNKLRQEFCDVYKEIFER